MSSHIPNTAMRTCNRITSVDLRNLPSASQAVSMYRQEGGRISDEACFGEDPLQGDNAKISIRAEAFGQRYPSFETIFHEIVNSNSTLFKSGLAFYVDVTYRLSVT